MTTLKEIIGTAAAKYGVPADLAEATAWHESSLDPTATGDNDTSFGLFQLHEGGELGNLTKEQAFDPTTNADTALAVFADFKRNQPDLAGGAWAAASQRPADPAAYAAAVNTIVSEIASGGIPQAFKDALAKDVTTTVDPTPAPVDPTPAPTPAPPEVTQVTASLPELKQGQQGLAVRNAQSMLSGIAVDGIFGPLTEAGVKFFQNQKLIPETGIVDGVTWERLIGVVTT